MAKYTQATYSACFFILIGMFHGSLYAHGAGAQGARLLDWKTDQIGRVMGRGGAVKDLNPEVVSIEGKRCIRGIWFDIDVQDSFAFDIDETVELEVEFYRPSGKESLGLTYDQRDSAPLLPDYIYAKDEVVLFSDFNDERWQKKRVEVPRARFANRGSFGSDLAIYSTGWPFQKAVTICDIRLRRSYATVAAEDFGQLELTVSDETGDITPVRAGIYAKDGRAPLPNEQAILLQKFDDKVRAISLRPGTGAWPIESRDVFYIDGHYRTRLPVGDYKLILAKGPEYRVAQRSFIIEANKTVPIHVKLQRWDNLPAKGWYSGDAHVHYGRDGEHDNVPVFALAEAENLHVVNLLQMGNSANVYFRQYAWEKVWRGNDAYVLAPGQEDPRTTQRGHTIHLNLKAPVRDPEHYLRYESIFEKTRAQGAVTGYAHASDYEDFPFSAYRRGMALDVPFGLVDFIEVLQFGMARTRTWFDFLNLGYRLSPVSGTDYPYVDVPGIVRTYAHVDGKFSPQSWFDSLKKGRVFVTEGPMLELEANGQGMGSELSLSSGDALTIRGSARINPDFGRLKRLVLIEQGEEVKAVSAVEGAETLEVDFKVAVKRGTWFVLRAEGGEQEKGAGSVALSAPIYVDVDGRGFWKPEAVPGIIAALKRDMQAMLEPSELDGESWETHAQNRNIWETNRVLLQRRVEQVSAIYDDLLKRAEQVLAEEQKQTLATQRVEETTPSLAK